MPEYSLQSMTYCGRMYQNPNNRKEIWVNCGWNRQDAQRYPDYEPCLAPHVTRDSYNKLMNAVKKEFEAPPEDVAWGPLRAMRCCICTLGLCIFPCLFINLMPDEFKKRVKETVKNLGESIGVNARFELKEHAGIYGDHWMDSKGIPLTIVGKHGHPSYLGGPPIGYNIILTLPQSVQWPPSLPM